MYEPTRSLRSETRGPLVKVPRTNLVTAGDQMVSTLGLLLRNTLTGNVRECSSQDGTTRTHLFTLSYGLEGFFSLLRSETRGHNIATACDQMFSQATIIIIKYFICIIIYIHILKTLLVKVVKSKYHIHMYRHL